MVWKYVANAVRLAEPDSAGTMVPLEDVWTTSGTGAASLDPGNVAGAWGTTTSSIAVEDSDGDWVFVFHNNYYALQTALMDEPGAGGFHQSRHPAGEVPGRWAAQLTATPPLGDLTTTTAVVERYLQLQKVSLEKFEQGLDPASADLEAGLGVTESMGGGSPFVETSIPYLTRENTGWDFEYIERYWVRSGAGPPSPRWGDAWPSTGTLLKIESGCSFFLAFRDPTVIEVPTKVSGGYQWLMIAKRVRVFHDSLATGAESVSQVNTFLGAKTSISDVVVFKSNNASFQNDDGANLVKGPYLLVDSLASVQEKQTFRTANRVPSAVFDGAGSAPDLYVYYVVESSVRADGSPGDYSFEEPFGGVTAAELQAKQDEWAGGSYADNGRGIAVKKVTYADLEAEVLNRDPADQASWTKDSAVTGELLGLVRVWMREHRVRASFTERHVRLWDDRFHMYDPTISVNYTPVKADPLAVWTPDGGIRLFFACFGRPAGTTGPTVVGADLITPANGWGIWHAASITAGARLHQSTDPMTTSATFKAVYGKDFVVRSRAGGVWPDMVAASDVNADDKRKFMDPDVFMLPDGAVVMLAGCERYMQVGLSTFESYGGNPLGRFQGDIADLVWPWTYAFE